jgi:hypothetical protein
VKLAGTENRLLDAERRVEALATLQSHRWMEFSKMADNMKELSHTMLAQSKSNTRNRFYESPFWPFRIFIFKFWTNVCKKICVFI